MNEWKAATILLFLSAAPPLIAAPIPPPRKINTRAPQLHLLDRDWIPQAERRPWHPAELVAILGDQNGHHWQYIESLSYSLDGKRIAAFSRGRVYVWEAPSLRFQALLSIQASFMQFVPEGNTLLTCGQDGLVRLWDVSGVKPRSRVLMRGAIGDFSRVAVSPNCKKIAVSTSNGFNLYDLSAASPKGTFLSLGKGMSLMQAVFSPNSHTLATLRGKVDWSWMGFSREPRITDQEAAIWDVSGPVPNSQSTLTGPTWQWGPFAFSPNGKTVVCGANVWDLSEAKPKFRGAMNGQEEDVRGSIFLPGGQHMITAGYKDSRLPIRVRDMRQEVPKVLQTVQLSDTYCRGMAVSPDGKTFVVGEVNCLHLWHLKEGKIEVDLPSHGHMQEVTALSFGACGNLLATIGRDESLRLWDLDGPRPRERLVQKREWASWDTVALSPDGTKLATGFRLGGVTLWDVTPSGLRVLAEHKSGGASLAFSPDSKTLFAGGGIDAIKVINVAKPKEVATALRPGRGPRPQLVQRLAISPDGKTLAVAGLSEIELWRRTEDGWKKPTDFRADILYTAATMSFGRDGTTLLVGGGFNKTGQVRIFDVSGEKPEQIASIDGHKAPVTSVSASSNGKLVASTDESGHVIVSSVGGEKLHEWTFPGPVRCVSFAPDGQHLALGNGDGTVYILRLPTPGP